MKTKTTPRTKRPASQPAPKPVVVVVLRPTAAEFFGADSQTPDSVLAYGPPGSDAAAKVDERIAALRAAGHTVEISDLARSQ